MLQLVLGLPLGIGLLPERAFGERMHFVPPDVPPTAGPGMKFVLSVYGIRGSWTIYDTPNANHK